MGPFEYVVERINGDYAELRRTDGDGEIVTVAMALLPPETDEGVRLRFENFSYEVLWTVYNRQSSQKFRMEENFVNVYILNRFR